MTQCRLPVVGQTDDVIGTILGEATPEVITGTDFKRLPDGGTVPGFLSLFRSHVDKEVAKWVRDEQRSNSLSRSNGWHNTSPSPSGCELTCKKVSVCDVIEGSFFILEFYIF